jgi:predicted nuclease of predicted toxin-antitoxin system
MRLLIDMNLTPRWVPHLADAGYKAHHWFIPQFWRAIAKFANTRAGMNM